MKLRDVTSLDHTWLVELHNDPSVLDHTRDPRPITINHHMSWWNKIVDDENEIRLIFDVNDERVGFAKIYSIDRYNKHCILGADIHPTFRGKGLAKFMWTLILEKCFDELNLNRVGLSVVETNVVAKCVYDKLGFIEEGIIKDCHFRKDKFYDAVCMYMLQSHWNERQK